MTWIPSPSPRLRVLITNSQVPRETSVLVTRVKEHVEAFPEVCQFLFQAMDRLSASFQTKCLRRSDEEDPVSTNTPSVSYNVDPHCLGQLMVTNHHCLAALGVSHVALEDIRTTLAPFPTKLTGAGGGGCTISLLPEVEEEGEASVLENAIAGLVAKGYTCVVTTLGGPGVLLTEIPPPPASTL